MFFVVDLGSFGNRSSGRESGIIMSEIAKLQKSRYGGKGVLKGKAMWKARFRAPYRARLNRVRGFSGGDAAAPELARD